MKPMLTYSTGSEEKKKLIFSTVHKLCGVFVVTHLENMKNFTTNKLLNNFLMNVMTNDYKIKAFHWELPIELSNTSLKLSSQNKFAFD